MWIARDKDNSIHIWSAKPHKEKDEWIASLLNYCGSLYYKSFPEVKWSDEEPKELILK